jgi:hypothetical protein
MHRYRHNMWRSEGRDYPLKNQCKFGVSFCVKYAADWTYVSLKTGGKDSRSNGQSGSMAWGSIILSG